VGEDGEGRRKGWMGGLTISVDTGDQVVCTVGQTDSYSSHDHTTSCADIQWDRIRPQATLLKPPKCLTWSIMVLHNFTGLATGHL